MSDTVTGRCVSRMRHTIMTIAPPREAAAPVSSIVGIRRIMAREFVGRCGDGY